jgi:hypothetical protein
MRRILAFVSIVCAALLSPVAAQDPGGDSPDRPAKKKAKDYSNAPIVQRMMAFDKNKDGKLTKDEVTDARLHRLFDLADTNKDGIVTKEELMALAAKLEAEEGLDDEPGFPGRRGRPRGGRGPGGPGGPGGPDDRGPGGPGGPGGPDDRGPGGPGGPGGRGRGGPGGFGGPPQPGQILPPFVQDALQLTPEQKKQVEDLQKEVDGKLGQILTDEQKKQLKDWRANFGRGGRGGRGPGGPRGEGRPPRQPPSEEERPN